MQVPPAAPLYVPTGHNVQSVAASDPSADVFPAGHALHALTAV